MTKSKLTLSLLMIIHFCAQAQRINVGFTFQYLIGKQVRVNNSTIQALSGNTYNVIDNRFKFFSAGQSFVIGTIAQLDYKKIYIAVEPAFELNTYNYRTQSASTQEDVTFKTLFYQIDIPLYVGYQFHTSDVIRYSCFAGIEPVLPYYTEVSFPQAHNDPSILQRYPVKDMQYVTYSSGGYANSLVGFGLHFASLGRLDIRYAHRLNSPGKYTTTFNTVGIALTYFLPLNLRKKKIYYVE